MVIQQLLPPLIREWFYRSPLRRYGWFGDYHAWADAKKASKGYDNLLILEKVKAAMLKVKNGEAAFERDSVVFDKIQYDWPMMASLAWVAAQNSGVLNVMDFGGSLGSTFYQHKDFLRSFKELTWNVVEQNHFVATGKDLFEDEQLKFYATIGECLQENNINVVLLSSVLPYLENPFALLEQITGPEFMIIDKMPLIQSSNDRITVQKIPPEIYPASYPAWFFSERKFMDYIEKTFDIVADFERDIHANFPASFRGFLLARK